MREPVLLDGDTDLDLPNDTLTVNTTPVIDVNHGTLTLFANGTFTYVHDGSENFTDSFTYQVRDALGNTDTAVVNIAITPDNDNTPVADGESFTVLEGGTATEADLDAGVNLLDGDTDLDLPNDTLTVDTTPVVNVSHGTLTLNANGTFTYVHDGSENFTDSFTYQVVDADGKTNNAVVNIAITPVNLPPTGVTPVMIGVDENIDTTAGYSLGTLTAIDGDTGETFSYSIVGGVDQLAFSIGGVDFDELILNDGILDFERQPSYQVAVRVVDSAGNHYDELITVDVNDLNETPTAILPTILSIDENVDTTSGYSLGLLNVVDEDSPESFTFSIQGGDDQLKFAIGGPGLNELILQDGMLDYESKASYEVIVRVADSAGNQYDESILVTVNDLNEAPTVSMTPVLTSLPENIDTAESVKVADIEVVDDALGSHELRVVGADAAMFEIVGGNELHLKAGTVINFETQTAFDVSVEISDPVLGSPPESADTTIPIDEIEIAFVPPVINSDFVDSDSSPTGSDEADILDSEEGAPDSENDGSDPVGVPVAPISPQVPLSFTTATDNDSDTLPSSPYEWEYDSGKGSSASITYLFNASSTRDIRVIETTNFEGDYSYSFAQLAISSFDALREEVNNDDLMEQVMLGTTMMATASLSVGYVVWLIRGGVLVSSVLSSLPAWWMVDPLPVLGFLDEEDEDGSDDSLESMVTKSNRSRNPSPGKELVQ